MKRFRAVLLTSFIAFIIIVTVLLNVQHNSNRTSLEEVRLNTMIYDSDIIAILGIEGLPQSTDTIYTDSTIQFDIRKNKIHAKGFFLYNESEVNISAEGDYKTYIAEGFENYYSGFLQGIMEIDNNEWNILMNYYNYEGKVGYNILVEPTPPNEGYTVFKFNSYEMEPGMLEKYKLVESD